jgi:hypothetical protein
MAPAYPFFLQSRKHSYRDRSPGDNVILSDEVNRWGAVMTSLRSLRSLRLLIFPVLMLLGSLTVSGCSSGSSGTSAANTQAGSSGSSGTSAANGQGTAANGQAGSGGGAPGAPVANGGGDGGGGGGPVAPGSPLQIPSIVQVQGEKVTDVIQSIEYGTPFPVDSGKPIVDQCPGKTLCVQVLAKVDPNDTNFDQCTATGNTDPAAGSTLPAGRKVIYVYTGSLLPCGQPAPGSSP